MTFSSLTFTTLFFPAVLILYFICTDLRWRNGVLLVASLIFYSWGEPIWVLAMIGSTAINYVAAMLIDRASSPGLRKTALVVGAAASLAVLFYFKYAAFLVNSVTSLFGVSFSIPVLELPIGISFYTFQAMSYVIDVYSGRVQVQKNILKFALYVSFFPQLIAGPIVKYSDVARQIDTRKESAPLFVSGQRRFICGLAKKVLLANTFALTADAVWAMEPEQMGSLTAWLGALSYTMQIYYDFSGYSDMAIGLGRMFGFRFKENFNYPYTSLSVQEFWRRWHISLSTWFKEYVYFPLGGSREGAGKTYRNVFIVFLLTGIWHGANFTFLAWGLLYALLQIIERLFLGKLLVGNPVKPVNWVYTMLMVILGWVLFRSDNIVYAGKYIAAMFGRYNGSAGAAAAGLGVYRCLGFMSMELIIAFAVAFAGMGFVSRALAGVYDRVRKKTWFMALDLFVMLGLLALCILRIISGTYNPFIYFKF